MSYKMCEDCVLISPMTNADSKSDGGIVVPGKVRDRPIIGTVLAVGPGMKLEDGTRFKETLKVGSIVVFPQKSGDSIYLDGQDFIVIPSRYILMIISEPDEEEEESRFPGNVKAVEEEIPEACWTGGPMKDAPENREKMEQYKNGDAVPINGDGNIIAKKEE